MPFSSSQWAILLPKNASLFPEITFYFPELPFHFPEVPFCFHKYLFISQKCPNVFHNSPWVLQKCLIFIYCVHLFLSRVSHSGGHGGGARPHPIFFETTSSSKPMPPMGCPPLKNEASQLKNNRSPLKSEVPFQETIPWKKNPKNRKLSLILVFHS